MHQRVGEHAPAKVTTTSRRSKHRSCVKGPPPQRLCPSDFDVIFVEQGRLTCETWYRARRGTVTRWMHERDAIRKAARLPTLIEARAAYVAHQRANGKWITRQTPLVEKRAPKPIIARAAPVRDRRKVSFTLARHAAQFLRIMRNGGHIISLASNGDWWIGTRRVSAAQLVEQALSKGFEPRDVSPSEEDMAVAKAKYGADCAKRTAALQAATPRKV